MFRLLNSLILAVFFLFEPALTLAQDDKEPPEYVLSYFLLLLFLGLAMLILMRPSKRTDSALTQDEVDAKRAEESKKKHGH